MTAKDPLNPELLGALCHDLRGPLGAIGTWVHVLSSGKARPEIQAQALAAMGSDVQAMGGLIEHLSILGSVLSGADPVRLESVDVVPLLETARLGVPREADFTVSFEVSESSLFVTADRMRLGQLITLFAGRGLTGRPGARTLRLNRVGPAAIMEVESFTVPPRPLSVALARALCQVQGGSTEVLGGLKTGLSASLTIAV